MGFVETPSTPFSRLGSSLVLVLGNSEEGDERVGGEEEMDVEPLRIIKADGNFVISARVMEHNPFSNSSENDHFRERNTSVELWR